MLSVVISLILRRRLLAVGGQGIVAAGLYR